MVCLFYKHFGDKVFLRDLNDRIVDEMLKTMQVNAKIPNCGILGRFDDKTVGLSVWYIGEFGRIMLLKEPTTHKTISSWAQFHMSDKIKY